MEDFADCAKFSAEGLVGRTYAGVLGPLAFACLALRGAATGQEAAGVLLTAWLGLWCFAAIGYAAGVMGDWIVAESVRERVTAELAAQEASAVPANRPGSNQ